MVVDTPLLTLLYTWLNGETDLVQWIDIPPGILRYAISWGHTTTANHEDGGWMIVVDSPDVPIHPSLWDPNDANMPSRFNFPFFVGIMKVPLMTPFTEGAKLGVQLTAAPTNGFTVILGFEPLFIDRRGQKHIVKTVQEQLELAT